MMIQIIIGCTLIALTSVIHAIGMSVGFRLIIVINHLTLLAKASILARSFTIAILILVMFMTTLIEAGVWALLFTKIGALPDITKAFYFSIVTYTTLGYGDIVLDESWRFLSSLEAANGIIMFGWTTAIVVVAIQQISRSLRDFASSV